MSNEIETAIVGALLIAPSDPMAPAADVRLAAFTPLPASVFFFPALVVASDDDSALSPERAFSFARQWGAGYALVHGCGHFQPADALGHWREGEELLDRFIDLVEPRLNTATANILNMTALCEPSGGAEAAPLFRH